MIKFGYKKFAVMSVIVIILIGVYGCMQNTQITKKHYTADEIVSIYDEKYNDTFTLIASNTEIWSAIHTEIILHSSLLNEDIVVWLYDDGYTTDNYIPVKFRSDVENRIKPLAELAYGDCLVSNSPIGYGIGLFTKDLTLEEYMRHQESCLMLNIAVSADQADRDEQLAAFVALLKENQITATICVFYYETLSEVTRTGLSSEPFLPMSDTRMYTIIDANYEIKYSQWSD